ncbi:MAG: 2-succinyl-6-hydroxy-2,4-cyclohexadiene-1-carboxylate synthase [Verrucomicrobia bacterium]|nr:2-succinyl-6-hydroxy-2,4-cyclohexadiene-1-carboxylate synthase [Verrucomicrobiota bacterium]
MKTLHYELTGEGATAVVLLHGFLCSRRDWPGAVLSALSAHRVLAVDLPGHGDSLRLPDAAYTFGGVSKMILAAMDACQIQRAALVGYSMGGRLALTLAVNHPGRWSHLVVESASPGLETEDDRRARTVIDDVWATKLEQLPRHQFLDEWYAQPVFESLHEDPLRLHDRVAQRADGHGAEQARSLRGFSVGRQPPLWDQLASISCPVMTIAGARDTKYVALTERMQRLCKLGQRVIVPNAGHHVHGEQPQAFANALLALL